ncbi:MAG: L-2-amino-thiazoline-4-carboxylic acid hydrolase [Bacilli bacterium]|mgnify:FL=1|nr:L-2-amino-thiazoline-4-carboxylic acid hydrolase [Bacilli bacterium]
MKEISTEKMQKINAMLDEDNARWNMKEKYIMYKALHEKYGDEINDLIARNIGKRTEDTFKEISKLLDDDSLEMFMKLLFDPLPSMGWKVEAKDEDGKFYRKVTYCPKCEMAKELGAQKLMYLLACCTDHYSSRGFNENIVFERTKTLMEGADCCDFCFYMKDKNK